MSYSSIVIKTFGEKFYNITEQIKAHLTQTLKLQSQTNTSGILHLFMPHTSCALTISESYDSSAKSDMENFLKHLARRNLPFIEHTMEGDDDSPSHMKSILLQQSLSLIVEEGHIVLGHWQGIFLAEFRDTPKNRELLLKFTPDK